MRAPILDKDRRLVGWTDAGTTLDADGRMRHAAAEALLGGPITNELVTLTGENAVIAGAPAHSKGPWHCFAIVPADEEGAPFSE